MASQDKRWWREPLVHFVGIGAVLFAADLVLNPPPVDSGVPTIEVTQELVDALGMAWDDKTGRPLSEAEQRAVLDSWIRSEALYREAVRLGLDRGDTIVRRRLVQKMEFLLEGSLRPRAPDEGELEAWFDEHAGDYTLPARTSFVHQYYSRSRRGDGTDAAASAALEQLVGAGPQPGPASGSADPFMGPKAQSGVTERQIEREFGSAFAASVIDQAPGSWMGPVRSSYGSHLVYVTDRQRERPASLDEQRAEALAAWRAEDLEVQLRDQVDGIVTRYSVEGS
ncbi:MAG: peptidyl-prolyl cis-trans isomerase C [Myxococcota bacterium]|jgi:peptidyl-prolyl cis-trans isomerase C